MLSLNPRAPRSEILLHLGYYIFLQVDSRMTPNHVESNFLQTQLAAPGPLWRLCLKKLSKDFGETCLGLILKSICQHCCLFHHFPATGCTRQHWDGNALPGRHSDTTAATSVLLYKPLALRVRPTLSSSV